MKLLACRREFECYHTEEELDVGKKNGKVLVGTGCLLTTGIPENKILLISLATIKDSLLHIHVVLQLQAVSSLLPRTQAHVFL